MTPAVHPFASLPVQPSSAPRACAAASTSNATPRLRQRSHDAWRQGSQAASAWWRGGAPRGAHVPWQKPAARSFTVGLTATLAICAVRRGHAMAAAGQATCAATSPYGEWAYAGLVAGQVAAACAVGTLVGQQFMRAPVSHANITLALGLCLATGYVVQKLG